MDTALVPADAGHIAEAAAIIRQGGLVAFPTETVYGLGADALNAAAVTRIFEAKGRPGDNPLIVHIASIDQVAPLIAGPLPEQAVKLAQAFWPGPLTMVLTRSDAVPDVVSAGLNTVGIRMPSHRAALQLIEAAGTPIAAPSANRSGKPSPTTAQHVLFDMAGRIPMILDGGPTTVGLESTVVDMTGDVPRVLRPGGVTPEMIERAVGAVVVDDSVLKALGPGQVARSPGMKYRHYAPTGKLSIVTGERASERIIERYDEAVSSGLNACILTLDRHMGRYGARAVRAMGPDADAAANRLFALLREMDELGVERIFAEGIDPAGVGLAVMNRMKRAAAFDVEEAN